MHKFTHYTFYSALEMPRILVISNPRSGSTYLRELLNSHPDIFIEVELLNEDVFPLNGGNPLDHVQKILQQHSHTFVGFKVFPQQISAYGINLSSLMKHVGCTHVIILWREGLLETFASLEIAKSTDVWYRSDATKSPATIQSVQVSLEEFSDYQTKIVEGWTQIGSEWPPALESIIKPIFVKYEDLTKDPLNQVKLILSQLGCSSESLSFNTPSLRMNPASISKKVSNYEDLPTSVRDAKLDVQRLLEHLSLKKLDLNLPEECVPYAPDMEPVMPPGGWSYRVASPFMPSQLKENVMDAIDGSSVSSAGYWPRLMSSKLRKLFSVPVAQPCSNGFSALVLALQCAGIGDGDEVIVPSLTMVAVPNAVRFLRATPVFADTAGRSDYNPDWTEIAACSSEKTKAVVVAHTYGVPCTDIEKIERECRRRGWILIEDISECVGVKVKTSTETKLLGSFGHFACASLYMNKMIHAGDGGFVLSKEPSCGPRLASLVNHGFTPAFHFLHFEAAINGKINGVGAAMACGSLDELDFVMNHRSWVAVEFRKALSGIPDLKLMPSCGPFDTPWVFGFQCRSKAQRTALRSFLAERGIETRDFFFPLHLQPAYFQKDSQRLEFSEELGSTGMYLPTHSNLTQEDINYISGCVRSFFGVQNQFDVLPPEKKCPVSVQISPESLKVTLKTYSKDGIGQQINSRGNLYISAVRVGLLADEILIHERWDERMKTTDEMKGCIAWAKEQEDSNAFKIERLLTPYIDYFESQVNFESLSIRRPWQTVELNSDAKMIPTTTDKETLQLLTWLVKTTQPNTMWEVGSWFGHSSVLAAAEGAGRVFACDAFRWQGWMDSKFKLDGAELEGNQSFIPLFKKFTEKYADSVIPVEWPYDIEELPEVLKNNRPELVYLDITQEDEELESIWNMMKDYLIPDKTVILFNGLSHTSIPFLTRHANELEVVAKPLSIAKAFRFTPAERNQPKLPAVLKRMNFQSDPEWTHHHNTLFCSSIASLRDKFHDPSSPVMFFPAIEELMCDEPTKFLTNQWVGIIHSVVDYPELFYAPDLRLLCSDSRKYSRMMKNCRGLFTLTEVQAEFLKANLKVHIPIQPLKYPLDASQRFEDCQSQVISHWKSIRPVDLVMIGSFARDFQFFFDIRVPSNLQKVLLTGDDSSAFAASLAPANVKVLNRLESSEYEELLKNSIIFLALKYDGAANTIVMECISRNLPIVVPRLKSCVEYLGESYPLFYNPGEENLERIITESNISNAVAYLKSMDKRIFSVDRFVSSFEGGIVMRSLSPCGEPSKCGIDAPYDVTISICSYKRTHHLPTILESLWSHQDFKGSFQIIIWNNNQARNKVVHSICEKYMEQSIEGRKSLELICSSENHFCSVRFAMPSLMKSKDCLLICDDDVIPGDNFVSFFHSAHIRHPKDILCVRGHVFLQHEMDAQNPSKFWEDYESLRFKDDDAPETEVHFVHADACLIPKAALREVASLEMPHESFNLVDDYWMSYVLSSKFGRKLRKLCTKDVSVTPIKRTEDSDEVGLALHTRPEVQDARERLYIHHMLQGWPDWEEVKLSLSPNEMEKLRQTKASFWESPCLGYNVSSRLKLQDVLDLKQMGVSCVRVGAVGVKEEFEFDLSGFLNKPEEELESLKKTVDMLRTFDISVVLTLERRLVSPRTWSLIAQEFRTYPNVVGYDLINEPFLEKEHMMHWIDVEMIEGVSTESVELYTELIAAIRKEDQWTPIIVEPTFWGRVFGLHSFPVQKLKQLDSNLIVSFHFYEPMLYTQPYANDGRFTFPCSVPVYDGISGSEVYELNEDYIKFKFQGAATWAKENDVKIFLGEFGVGRLVGGAEKYLAGIINACKESQLTGFVFSFRDSEWDAMDYELGTGGLNRKPEKSKYNPILEVIENGFQSLQSYPNEK